MRARFDGSTVWRAVVMALALARCDGDTQGDAGNGDAGNGVERNFDDRDVPIARDGLTGVGRVVLPRTALGEAHLTRLLVHGDVVYGANSFDGINAWRLGSDGSLTAVYASSPARTDLPPPPGTPPPPRCTALALHAPSSTLLCAAADREEFGAWRVSDPAAPAPRPDAQPPGDPRAGHLGLYLAGDTLYAASGTRGLLRATVGADGTRGAFTAAGLRSEATAAVDGEGSVVAVLDRTRGLLTATRAPDGALTERGALALDGPALGLTVRGDRALAALGSQGVVVARIGEGAPTLERRIDVGCAVVTADVSGDALAVACTTGVALVDLRPATPRIVGWYPALFSALDVRFVGARLLVADWREVRSFDVDLDARVTRADVPLGVYVRRDAGLAVPVRNPGDRELHVRLRFDDRPRCPRGCFVDARALVLGPGVATRVQLSRDELDAHTDAEGNLTLVAVSRESGAANEAGWFYRVLRVDPARPVTQVGGDFPTMTRAADAQGPMRVPAAGVAATVALIVADCALQWPGMTDLAWIASHGGLPGGRALTVLVSDPSPTPGPWIGAPFATHLGVDARSVGRLADYAASLGSSTAAFAVLDTRFTARGVGGADNVANFDVSAGGRLDDIAMIHRGRWPVRTASP